MTSFWAHMSAWVREDRGSEGGGVNFSGVLMRVVEGWCGYYSVAGTPARNFRMHQCRETVGNGGSPQKIQSKSIPD